MRRISLLVALVAVLSIAPFTRAQSARHALNLVLPELNFSGVTLTDAIDFLRDVSGTNIHVNWPALEAMGVGRDTTINLRLRNVSMRKVLDLVLREAGTGDLLAFYVDDGVIEITTKEVANETMFTRLYPVEDLIMDIPDFVGPEFTISGGGSGGNTSPFSGGLDEDDEEPTTRLERAQQLIDIIQEVIEPDVWNVNGGRAAIRFFNGSLIVTAPRSVHEALGGYVD